LVTFLPLVVLHEILSPRFFLRLLVLSFRLLREEVAMSVLEAYRRDPLARPIVRDVNYLTLLTALLLYPLLPIPVRGHCELYLIADPTDFQIP
jgi:hypothetical protein